MRPFSCVIKDSCSILHTPCWLHPKACSSHMRGGATCFFISDQREKKAGDFHSFLPCLLSPWLISELATSKVYEIFISQSYHFLKLEDRGSAFPEAHGCTGEELIPEHWTKSGFCFVLFFKKEKLTCILDRSYHPCAQLGREGKKNFFKTHEKYQMVVVENANDDVTTVDWVAWEGV